MLKLRTILWVATIVFGFSVIFTPIYAVNAPTIDIERAVFLKPLPAVLEPATCNCMQFAKSMGVKNIPVDEPLVGGGILLREGPIGHIAIILEIDANSFIVVESNYKKCAITYRRIDFDYSKIIGFVK